jgi:hypothetical protein
VELALGVALLLLPVALGVLAFGPWIERRVVAEAAAAEAARTAVVSLDLSRGGQVVSDIGSNHHFSPDTVRLGWCGSEPGPAAESVSGCSLARGSQVVAEVRIWTPLVATPWGSIGGVWVIASHAETIDAYRSFG